MERKAQTAKAAKASQSQPRQAKASKRKQKQAIEPARAWVQNEFHCNNEHQPKSCEDLPKTPQQPRIVHKGPESPRMFANSSQTLPKSSPNPLKSNQNPSQTAPRAPLKTTPNTRMKKRASKTTQEAPRAYKPFPKLPPNPAKWSPRRPQIRFLKAFLACFFLSQMCIDFLHLGLKGLALGPPSNSPYVGVFLILVLLSFAPRFRHLRMTTWGFSKIRWRG